MFRLKKYNYMSVLFYRNNLEQIIFASVVWNQKKFELRSILASVENLASTTESFICYAKTSCNKPIMQYELLNEIIIESS